MVKEPILPVEAEKKVFDELWSAILNKVKKQKAQMSQIKATLLGLIKFTVLPVMILYATQNQKVTVRVQPQQTQNQCHPHPLADFLFLTSM